MDLGQFRQEYTRAGIDEDTLAAHPMEQFEAWFKQALDAGMHEPNAMVLATVGADGVPTTRTVLLKQYDRDGFVFYTNYTSQKARQIAENANVSLLFPWITLERQVVIRGKAEKISTAQSLKYFISRPHGSRLGAWVSDQSSVITSRKFLEMQLEKMKQKFADGTIPLPDFWGGYLVRPQAIEFWQGRENRLHDRLQYVLQSSTDWKIQRLAP